MEDPNPKTFPAAPAWTLRRADRELSASPPPDGRAGDLSLVWAAADGLLPGELLRIRVGGDPSVLLRSLEREGFECWAEERAGEGWLVSVRRAALPPMI